MQLWSTALLLLILQNCFKSFQPLGTPPKSAAAQLLPSLKVDYGTGIGQIRSLEIWDDAAAQMLSLISNKQRLSRYVSSNVCRRVCPAQLPHIFRSPTPAARPTEEKPVPAGSKITKQALQEVGELMEILSGVQRNFADTAEQSLRSQKRRS